MQRRGAGRRPAGTFRTGRRVIDPARAVADVDLGAQPLPLELRLERRHDPLPARGAAPGARAHRHARLLGVPARQHRQPGLLQRLLQDNLHPGAR